MANHVHSFLGHESPDLLYIYEMFFVYWATLL